jgi:hypothetical protein
MTISKADLPRRLEELGVVLHVHGDAAAVVQHGDRVVLVDDDVHVLGVAGQHFVDGVVHGLVDEVVQSAGARVADVHGGPVADGVQPLQDLNFGRVVVSGAAPGTTGRLFL